MNPRVTMALWALVTASSSLGAYKSPDPSADLQSAYGNRTKTLHPSTSPATATIRVSPNPSGSSFSRIEYALQQARTLQRAGQNVTILFAPGTYRLERSLTLTEVDSGTPTRPLRLVGDLGGEVIFSGNEVLKPVPVPRSLAALLSDEAARGAGAYPLPSALLSSYFTQRRREFNAAPVAASIWLSSAGILSQATWPGHDYLRFPKALPNDAGKIPLSSEQAHYLSLEPAVDVEGYFTADFAWEKVRVAQFDLKQRQAIAEPLSTKYSTARFRRVKFSNVFRGIDRPGTYAVDFKRRVAVVWPRKGRPVEIAVVNNVVSVAGAHDIIIDGIALEGARGDALRVTKARNIQFTNGALRAIGGRGAAIDATNTNVEISKTVISDTGEAGVDLDGGTFSDLVHGKNILRDSVITRAGSRGATTRPGVAVRGVGQIVEGCFIYDMPRAGIAFTGTEILISNNEITDTNHETGDYGAMYTFANLAGRGTKVIDNYVHDIATIAGLHRNVGIYLDAWSSGIAVERNIFSDLRRAIWINSGSENIVRNNVIVRAEENAVQIDNRAKIWSGAAGKQARKSIANASPMMIARYGNSLLKPLKNFGAPVDNIVSDNIVFNNRSHNIEEFFTAKDYATRDRIFSIGPKNTPVLRDSSVKSAASLMKIPISTLDRKTLLSDLRYIASREKR